LAVPAGKYEVAVFHLEDGFYAIENCCPHQGGPLADGHLDGPMVTCPWHAWCFDVRSGKMSLGEFAIVPRFEVKVQGDTILVATEPENE
jgi:nitrite reductase/ring-hydroxylating ferredoxin subunit